jgi:hypothetical protein
VLVLQNGFARRHDSSLWCWLLQVRDYSRPVCRAEVLWTQCQRNSL